MSRKDVLNNLFTSKLGAPNRADAPPRRAGYEPVRSGAVSAVSSVLSGMADDARAADELRDLIKAGTTVIEIDPGLVDGSAIADRLPTPKDPKFDALVESMRAYGQKVPILVRPHPTTAGRYQIARGLQDIFTTAAQFPLFIPINAKNSARTDIDVNVR